MTAEILCVGTELLLGNIVNTNAAYLAEKLAGVGISCYYQSVVGDNEERLTKALQIAMSRADIVILSGGLGPTEDDLTKEVAAKVCGRKLSIDESCMEQIAEYFASRSLVPTENNWKQAKVPEGGLVLENPNGTAPGIIIETEHNRLILLPGPPSELIPMFEEKVSPYLQALTSCVICSQTVKLVGVPESEAETRLQDLIDSQTNPTLATYAKIGEVHIRVTASAANEKDAFELMNPMVEELKSRFGDAVYTTREDVTIEAAVAELLRERGLEVTTAESCTGGMIGARLVNVPGISEAYRAGLITYSNKAKRRLLGVKKSTLEKYGAVSAQTAKEMAKGAAAFVKADAAISVTGIAGPDGGTAKKPVGLVYMACCVNGRLIVEEHHFKGNRAKIREAATVAALALLRKGILAYGEL